MAISQERVQYILDVILNDEGITQFRNKLKTINTQMQGIAKTFAVISQNLKGKGFDSSQVKLGLTNFSKNMNELKYNFNAAGEIISQVTKDTLSYGKASTLVANAIPKVNKQINVIESSLADQTNYWKGIQKSVQDAGYTYFQAMNGVSYAKKQLSEMGYVLNKNMQMQKQGSKSIMKTSDVIRSSIRGSMRPFRAEWLSLLFLGMGLQATFGGIIKSVLQMTGIFDAFRGILAGVLLPILMPLIAKWLPKFMEFLQDEGNRKFVGWMIILAAVLGYILSPIAQLGLFLNAMGLSFKAIGVWLIGGAKGFAAFGNVIIRLAGIISIVIGVFSIFYGFISGKVWPVIQGLLLVLAGVLAFFGAIPAVIGAAIVGLVMLANKFEWVKKTIMTLLLPLKGLVDLIFMIKDIATGKMGFGEAIRGFGARLSKGTLMDYLPGMAEGGIVTKPTIAMIGEAGPEAVVPLGRGGTPLNYNPIINVTSNGNSIDVNSLVRTINEKLYADLRRVGVR